MTKQSPNLMPTATAPIQLIYAGGTFGSYGRPLASLDACELLPVLQDALQSRLSLDIAWVDNALIKDSSQLTPRDFVHFYTLILAHYRLGHRQFVLITGTDTLSYLGAFLAEAFAESDICITLTGSMKPLLDTAILSDYMIDQQSDAWDNLSTALRQTSAGRGGVRICFGGEVWPAQTVQKIHSHDLMAFTGHLRAGYPDSSYEKRMTDTRRQQWCDDASLATKTICERADDARVHAIFCLPNDARVIENHLAMLIDTNHDSLPCAIVLLGFGAGNLPYSQTLATVLDTAYKRGHMIVCASQCPFGGVSDQYAAGSWQYDHHVLLGGRLTTPAIYARLLWLLLRFDSPAARRRRWTYSVKQTTDKKSR